MPVPSDLHHALLQAVTPFEQGVAALKVNALRVAGATRPRPGRTAAVLVPILDIPDPEIVLTVRSVLLPKHPGQVSFPGGAVDQTDQSAVSTALREAEEEIGLSSAQVSPIGFLDRVDTVSDYRVLPVVGLVKPPFIWRPNQREVSEVFTVPLSLVIDRNEYTQEEILRGQRSFMIPTLQWQGHKIWGVTAAILFNLASRMARATP